MYKVTCLYHGTTYTIHDPESDNLRIYNDEIETEDNEPGSFKFTVSYNHPYLDKIAGLESDIRVYDGNEEIFRGRPIDDGEDLYRMRTFTCEGELAFLYDSIQPRRELHDISPLQFLTLLLNEHNAQVANKGPIDKTFRVGAVTVTDPNDSLYRYTNRETTLDCIGDKLLNRLGGHLCVRISGGYRYLDLLKEVTTVGDQPIQLGENLLDYAKDTDYTQVATACIPLGERMDVTEIAALDAYVTVETVNNGSDCLVLAQAVRNYGFICKVVNFEDISLPANLKTAGENWLTDGQYADMTLTLTAVDLHGLGHNVQPIRKNTKIRVLSDPHGMNRWFEVSKRTYHLTQPEADTVIFGTSERKKSFTASSKKQVTEALQHTDQLRQDIDTVITQERQNVSNILNLATHGYVVLDPNSGPERILIMDTNSVSTATKIWKWDMNGLAYGTNSTPGVPLDQWTWSTAAITMNGEISASFIVTGTLLASLIKVGILSDVNGLNYWNMETGEFQLASTATVGGKTVAELIDESIPELTQSEVFNILTNNGAMQGIFMRNGTLYINGSYIYGGTLVLGGNNNQNGVMSVRNSYNEECVSVDKDGINVVNGTTRDRYHRNAASKMDANGLYNQCDYYSSYTDQTLPLTSGVQGGEFFFTIRHNSSNYTCRMEAATSNVVGMRPYVGIASSLPIVVGDRGTYNFKDNQGNGNGVENNSTSCSYMFNVQGGLRANSLTVLGTKNREADTKNYNKRLLYCYEMPSPMFGDIGSGKTDENGECIVEIDDIYAETVRTDITYQVFLQKEGLGDLYVDQKTPRYFVVKGTPNLPFAWEVKAKQAGFESLRIDEPYFYHAEERDVLDESFYDAEIDSIYREVEEVLYATA